MVWSWRGKEVSQKLNKEERLLNATRYVLHSLVCNTQDWALPSSSRPTANIVKFKLLYMLVDTCRLQLPINEPPVKIGLRFIFSLHKLILCLTFPWKIKLRNHTTLRYNNKMPRQAYFNDTQTLQC